VRTPERLAASINKSVTSDMFLEQQRPSKQGRCTNNNKDRKKDMDHVDTTAAAEASIHERIIRGTQATKSNLVSHQTSLQTCSSGRQSAVSYT
jgi:hypothetical protein